MAKKSAKSKGFRRQTTQKPYLNKRDIAILCVLLVAIGIGAFFLFRYDDGALKVQNGAVVASGDNWLIVDGSNTRGRSRYFKLGEVGDIEGFDRAKESLSVDSNVPQYVYTPQTEGVVDSITVTSSHTGAEALARYASAALDAMDNSQAAEPQSAELAGMSVQYFIYTVDEAARATEEASEATEEPAEASEEAVEEAAGDTAEAAENTSEEPAEGTEEARPFRKIINAYVDASHESCVVLHVDTSAASAEAAAPDDALVAALEQAVAAVTLESEK